MMCLEFERSAGSTGEFNDVAYVTRKRRCVGATVDQGDNAASGDRGTSSSCVW